MSCPYGTMEWYCRLPAGHAGPHESHSSTPPREEPRDAMTERAWVVSMHCTHGRWVGKPQFGACISCIAAALRASLTGPRRIECASCHKAPTDEQTVVLTRQNVKGIPGVYLCQFCRSEHRPDFIAELPAPGPREPRPPEEDLVRLNTAAKDRQ